MNITSLIRYGLFFLLSNFCHAQNFDTNLSENITIAGPLAAIAVEDNVFWMGAEEFYAYGGAVQRLPCSVRDYVFTNINNNVSQIVY